MFTLNIDQDKLTIVKKPVALYLLAVGILVALYFVVHPFFSGKFDVTIVWHVLDVMMFLGLGLALGANYFNKRDKADNEPGTGITKQYLEANLLFFVTAVLTMMFLYNWFSLLSHGNFSITTAQSNIWNVIDIALPITFGLTACRLCREG